jgi:hypothetical protein
VRRLIVALTLVLLASSPAQAAIAHVQTVSCSAHGATSCTTGAVTTTNGSLFIVSTSFCCVSGDFTSITDSKSNTYVNAVPAFNQDSAWARQDYIASGTGGASHTFTVNGTVNLFATISVHEVSGAAASPLDKIASNSIVVDTSHTSTATTTTSQANELLVGAGGSTDTTTYTTDTGAGWTERTNVATDANTEGGVFGTRIVAATGTYAYTYTTGSSARSVSLISTWKEAAAAGVRQRCIGCGADSKVIE